MGKTKYPSDDEGAGMKTAEVKANYSGSDKRYMVIFKHNRSFELHIKGKIVHIFAPNGSAILGADIVDHPDFVPVRAYFNIKEA